MEAYTQKKRDLSIVGCWGLPASALARSPRSPSRIWQPVSNIMSSSFIGMLDLDYRLSTALWSVRRQSVDPASVDLLSTDNAEGKTSQEARGGMLRHRGLADTIFGPYITLFLSRGFAVARVGTDHHLASEPSEEVVTRR